MDAKPSYKAALLKPKPAAVAAAPLRRGRGRASTTKACNQWTLGSGYFDEQQVVAMFLSWIEGDPLRGLSESVWGASVNGAICYLDYEYSVISYRDRMIKTAKGIIGDPGSEQLAVRAAADFPHNLRAVAYAREGVNDEASWLLLGQLHEGGWVWYTAGCDYTGFDCQGSMSLVAASTAAGCAQRALGNYDRTLVSTAARSNPQFMQYLAMMQRMAATTIQAAFRGWSCRRRTVEDPNTAIGKWALKRRIAADIASDALLLSG